jgi:hypothetical protein
MYHLIGEWEIELKDDSFQCYRLLLTHTSNQLKLLNFFITLVFNDLIFFFSFSHICYKKYTHQSSFTKASCNENNEKNDSPSIFTILLSIPFQVIINVSKYLNIFIMIYFNILVTIEKILQCNHFIMRVNPIYII